MLRPCEASDIFAQTGMVSSKLVVAKIQGAENQQEVDFRASSQGRGIRRSF
jgi:hypothetical protein